MRHELPTSGRITAMPPEGRHAHGQGGLVFDDHGAPPWVQVWPLTPTGAAGEVQNLLRRLLLTVGAAIDMQTRAIARGKTRRQAQALGRGRGHEAGECCDASRIQGIQGPPAGLIVERRRRNAERKQAGGRLVLAEARDEGERLMETSQAIAPQRFAGFPHGQVAHCRVVMRGVGENITHTECVKHASHQPEIV
jgi:hypothetical protein